MAELVITIDSRGQVDIDAQGFQGSECTKASERIKVALNGKETKDDKKPEFYAQTSTSTEKLVF